MENLPATPRLDVSTKVGLATFVEAHRSLSAIVVDPNVFISVRRVPCTALLWDLIMQNLENMRNRAPQGPRDP